MSRGRKPLPPAAKVEVAINHEVVAADSAAVDGENSRRLARIEELYGDGDAYRLETCIQKARFYLNSSAEAMLDAGKQLLRIKEHEPHGDFLRALERIGFDPRTAQRLMQAATKFCRPNARPAAHLGKTKILELMAEDDETIDSLGKGGTVAGLSLDDIERMSAHEVRAALRKERQNRREEAETHERLLIDKNKKLDEYAKREGDVPARIFDLRRDAVLASGGAIAAINQLSKIRLDAREVPGYDRHVEEIVGAVGLTFLSGLYQIQAYLSEEINYAEQDFSGTKIEINAGPGRGPDLSDEQIQYLKDAGADAAADVLIVKKTEEPT